MSRQKKKARSGGFSTGCQADFRDPETGRRERATIRAVTQADAKQEAKNLSQTVADGQWVSARRSDAGPTVGQALEAAINANNASLERRTQYTWNANRFLAWLAKEQPAVKCWSQVKTDANHKRSTV